MALHLRMGARDVREALAKLDAGPSQSRLEELRSLETDPLSPLRFALADKYSPLLKELTTLIEDYLSLAARLEGVESAMVAKSVASWVFHTNKLEHVGTESLGDTEAIIASRLPSLSTKEEKAVMRTFSLLQGYSPTSFRAKQPSLFVSFDPLRIKTWHLKLVDSVDGHVGEFRQDGRFTTRLDGTQHFFPHHDIQEWSVQRLCQIVHSLLKSIPNQIQGHEARMGMCFALAAFAQYHFVSLHPFEDGNGRICRLLSKKLLEWVLPVPFPMFLDRNTYRKVLEEGDRASDAQTAPIPLFELLLDSAIAHFKFLLSAYGDLQPSDLVVATNLEQLQEVARKIGVGAGGPDNTAEAVPRAGLGSDLTQYPSSE
ncbi:hypothetical protein KFL_004140020 [Klebsormidium nitens]|uniref:Fido domain-containing protein n=1 Tax=Klebsormidium nitens TaxID=105231 RepID=A0A0U9HVL9_KLENI|nr:hypothetical protein KFL_004140020 [Klebsormidium nitens]|eukprot:GAQ88266.1 hypothetical protein KFL_004140020 [Klebsormidium nitens]